MTQTTIQTRLDEICSDQGVPLGHGKMRSLGRILGISGSRVSQIYAGSPTLRLGEESITRLVTLGYSPAWVQEGKGSKLLSGNIATPPRPIDAEHEQPTDLSKKTVASLLGSIRERIELQPQPVREAIASLVSEYFKSPDAEQGQAVADAIERLIGKL